RGPFSWAQWAGTEIVWSPRTVAAGPMAAWYWHRDGRGASHAVGVRLVVARWQFGGPGQQHRQHRLDGDGPRPEDHDRGRDLRAGLRAAGAGDRREGRREPGECGRWRQG